MERKNMMVKKLTRSKQPFFKQDVVYQACLDTVEAVTRKTLETEARAAKCTSSPSVLQLLNLFASDLEPPPNEDCGHHTLFDPAVHPHPRYQAELRHFTRPVPGIGQI